ncbi:transposase [Bacillus sp. 1NLA3E]|uniref:transposase n=1 Tax=Bacillus sp. 1NLA3E TaxID=666686 RepID=UPI001181BB27
MLYKFRKEIIERSFADLKSDEWASLLPVRGMKNVSEQSLLMAACQSIKKLQHTWLDYKRCVAVL